LKIARAISVVDSHTAGEPTRVIIGGIPHIKGKTMAEKKRYFEEKLSHIRKMLMWEPRGHGDMFGAVLTEPTTTEADIGVLFMDTEASLNMCGHGSIGVTSILIKLNMVEVKEPITEITLDTPAGLVKAWGRVEEGELKEVTIENVPAFFYDSVEIDLPNIGRVHVDISFGGNFFGVIDSKELGIELKMENIPKLIPIGMEARKLINQRIRVQHPILPHIDRVELVEITGAADTPEATMKNVVIFVKSSVDRSPCGTGTCARMAELYHLGKLKLNEDFYHESIIGTVFKGRLVRKTKVGNIEAVIPQITGKAYITGLNTWIKEVEDETDYGFLIPR